MMQDVQGKLNAGLPCQKAAFNNKKILYINKLDLKKKQVKCFIWSIALMVLKLEHFGK